MAECLTCEEIEQRICDLSDELTSLSGCQGTVASDGGIQIDNSAAIKAKELVLNTFVELHKAKCKGANELYEFVHVPCVRPATCVGTTCRPSWRTTNNRRRYRR